jgi:hypothetical protein
MPLTDYAFVCGVEEGREWVLANRFGGFGLSGEWQARLRKMREHPTLEEIKKVLGIDIEQIWPGRQPKEAIAQNIMDGFLTGVREAWNERGKENSKGWRFLYWVKGSVDLRDETLQHLVERVRLVAPSAYNKLRVLRARVDIEPNGLTVTDLQGFLESYWTLRPTPEECEHVFSEWCSVLPDEEWQPHNEDFDVFVLNSLPGSFVGHLLLGGQDA